MTEPTPPPTPPNRREALAAPTTFTDRVRKALAGLLNWAGHSLHRLGISPNAITVVGFLGQVGIAALLAQGYFLLSAILIIVLAPLDALDGATARASGKVSAWGAFLDSTLDRLSEAALLFGLLVYYLTQDVPNANLNAALAFLAFVGSVMVSYTRARAEAVNYKASVGWLSRLERYLVLIVGLLIGRPALALWVIAILANLTAVQRLWHVRKQYYASLDRPADDEHTPPT